jgi:hypothetical protein
VIEQTPGVARNRRQANIGRNLVLPIKHDSRVGEREELDRRPSQHPHLTLEIIPSFLFLRGPKATSGGIDARQRPILGLMNVRTCMTRLGLGSGARGAGNMSATNRITVHSPQDLYETLMSLTRRLFVISVQPKGYLVTMTSCMNPTRVHAPGTEGGERDTQTVI